MPDAVHETYALDLLSSLLDEHPESDTLSFEPDRTKSRNAAKSMEAMLCHRLHKKARHHAKHIANTTYEWKGGIFNCRTITDRDYIWSNMRRNVADGLHQSAQSMPVAYLLAFSNPSDTALRVWAIPEPILYDSLPALSVKKGGQEYYIVIHTNRQRIEHYPTSPDLTPYFQDFQLSRQELLILKESREVDALVKRERAIARGKQNPDADDDDDDSGTESETNKLLATVAHQLDEAGDFNPSGIADARERVLKSIVRRRGQPTFRQRLLAAYKGRCAISGCDVEAVLEAAHIVPYIGPETNHLGNGLLLRADLHTLFDLSLLAVDVVAMTVIVAPSPVGTCYQEFHGRPITVPEDTHNWPSREALDQHRKESAFLTASQLEQGGSWSRCRRQRSHANAPRFDHGKLSCPIGS